MFFVNAIQEVETKKFVAKQKLPEEELIEITPKVLSLLEEIASNSQRKLKKGHLGALKLGSKKRKAPGKPKPISITTRLNP